MKKVVSLGELLIRLSPPRHDRFLQARSFDLFYGGGEANWGVSMQTLGYSTTYVTKVPAHEIGQASINALRANGVNTEHIARGGERLGVYYLENTGGSRASKVIYDRKNSSISQASVDEFDWDAIFEGCALFHTSGITAAISKNGAELALKAAEMAKKHGALVSFDANYRSTLWSGAEAQAFAKEFMPYVDICIANDEDIFEGLGVIPEGVDPNEDLDEVTFQRVQQAQAEAFPNVKIFAGVFNPASFGIDKVWRGLLFDGKHFYRSGDYQTPIIDRVGIGDAFAAGLDCALLDGKPMQDVINFATAALAVKHTVPGDFNLASRSEIENAAKGSSSARIQR